MAYERKVGIDIDQEPWCFYVACLIAKHTGETKFVDAVTKGIPRPSNKEFDVNACHKYRAAIKEWEEVWNTALHNLPPSLRPIASSLRDAVSLTIHPTEFVVRKNPNGKPESYCLVKGELFFRDMTKDSKVFYAPSQTLVALSNMLYWYTVPRRMECLVHSYLRTHPCNKGKGWIDKCVEAVVEEVYGQIQVLRQILPYQHCWLP